MPSDYSPNEHESDENPQDYGDDWGVTDPHELEERVEALESSLKDFTSGDSPRYIFGGGFWGLGMTIAVVLSWSRSGSILWCILHGLLSWAYVIYFALTR